MKNSTAGFAHILRVSPLRAGGVPLKQKNESIDTHRKAAFT